MAFVKEGASGLQPVLGERLRQLRKERRLSLAEVAQAVDLSTSFLSLVETGRSDITIGRLMRLVGFYDVSLTDLVSPLASADRFVVRAGEQRAVPASVEGIHMRLLAPDTERVMMPFRSVLEPGARMDEPTAHAGDEFIHVVEGTLEVAIDGVEPVLLRAGDSIYFPADLRHAYRNADDGEVRLFGVVTPPSL